MSQQSSTGAHLRRLPVARVVLPAGGGLAGDALDALAGHGRVGLQFG